MDVKKYRPFPELKTNNLILRQFKLDDADVMYKSWTTDVSVSKYLNWKPHKNKYETLGLVTSWINGYLAGNYVFAIVEKETNKLIGSINLKVLNPGKCTVSVVLARPYWHKGYGMQAVKAVSKYAFEELKTHRIEATVIKGNDAAEKIFVKLGYSYEGTAVDDLFFVKFDGYVSLKKYAYVRK